MNIFYLDEDPDLCARYHCDKHLVKMILETAQLLCNVFHYTDPEQADEIPYKATHLNHPCSKWVRENTANYSWTIRLGLALCKEYTHRYDKKHKSEDVIRWCDKYLPDIEFSLDRTAPALVMSKECIKSDPVESYRAYYRAKRKETKMNYTNRNIPDWFYAIL